MKESYVKGLANQFDNKVEEKLPETVEYVKAYSPPVGHRKDAGEDRCQEKTSPKPAAG
ncbi:MAG: hypothetical protein M3Q91_08840 [Acidobacteriota bacterium]|nr:hypothetical protein [Acidobacteriota bacterium]